MYAVIYIYISIRKEPTRICNITIYSRTTEHVCTFVHLLLLFIKLVVFTDRKKLRSVKKILKINLKFGNF